jgi:hypothetical protein
MTKEKGATLPSVDISSGVVQNGPIVVGDPFLFTTSSAEAIDGITVSAASQDWFSPYLFTFNSPGDGTPVQVTVTAELSNPTGWSFNVTGMDRSNNNPHVPVDPSFPETKAS